MELSGWLHKRSSGRVKSWKRRYFIFNQEGVLYYYSKEPSENSSKLKGSLQITSFSDNVGSLKRKIPKQFDPKNAIVLTTTHPGKQIFLVVAESAEQKQHWLTGLDTCFQPERSLDISAILSSQTDYYGNIFDIDDILLDNDDVNCEHGFLPPVVQRRIACFIGDIHDVVRLSGVSKTCYHSLRYSSRSKMWMWLVRHGALQERRRWKFWCHVMNSERPTNRDEFNRLIREASVFNKYEIDKDVNRAFGVSVSKRVTERRSILPPNMSDDDLPMKYRLSIGGMQSITEGESDRSQATLSEDSDCDSSCNGSVIGEETEENLDDDDGGVEGGRKAWGRGGRSTMRWPETPNDEGTKKSSSTRRGGRSKLKTPRREKAKESRVNVRVNVRENLESRGDTGDEGALESMSTSSQSQSPPKTPPRSLSPSHLPPPCTPSSPPALTNEDIQRKKLSLTRILQALSSRFESVGYCQGLDRIVVHCMRAARCAVSSRSCPECDLDRRDEIDEKRERECFAFLDKLFTDLSLTDVYSSDNVFGLKTKIWILGKLFEFYCPDLHHNLEEEGVSMEIFSIGWIQTLFLYVEAMPAHTIDRIWDIFAHEKSWVIIFQVAIAIMKLSEDKVLGQSIDFVINYFNQFPDESILEPEVLLKEASRITLNAETLRLMEEQYALLG